MKTLNWRTIFLSLLSAFRLTTSVVSVNKKLASAPKRKEEKKIEKEACEEILKSESFDCSWQTVSVQNYNQDLREGGRRIKNQEIHLRPNQANLLVDMRNGSF